MASDGEISAKSARDKANVRLAIIIGLVAFGIYAGYLLLNFLT
jgi:hypothetical protein